MDERTEVLNKIAEAVYLQAQELDIDDMDSSDSYSIAGRIMEKFDVRVK